MFHVNVYELDRRYGGPEEGGWWVTTGTPVKAQCRKAHTMEEAVDLRTKMLVGFKQPFYRVGSVNYAGGELTALIEEHPAKAFPEHWPHYE